METLFGPLLEAHYRSVQVDPPWRFSAGTKGRPQHYPRMTDEEIAAIPLARLAHPDGCHYFVWITSPMARRFWRNIEPSWRKQGLVYSGRAFVWCKTHMAGRSNGDALFLHRDSFFVGQGFTTRKNAEDCLLFKIGRPKRLRRDVRELIIAARREHSRKPDEAYRRIEQYSAGPYADVFSRESRAGWHSAGNEAGKFNQEAA